MPVAFNKETGELRVLDRGGQWVAPKVAKNPQTGEQLYLEGDEWKPIPLTNAEIGAGRAAAALQGPTLGFGDELVATLENPIESLSALQDYAPSRIGGRIAGYLRGEDAPPERATPGYDESLERFRGIENRYRQARPGEAFLVTAGAGMLGGGVQAGAGALNAVGRALPQAGNITRAALTGAGFGGAAGFGSGEGGIANRLISATFGAGTGAATGATFEALSPVAARFWRSIRGNPQLADDAGNLTAQGRQSAVEAGLDPDEMTLELRREFSQQARDALDPGQAAAVAEARSLPTPVNLTRGQTTLRPDDQMFESQAAKDVYGVTAGAPVRGAFEAQQAALRENVPAIATRIGGGQVREFGQGVQQAQQALTIAERAAKGRVNTLFDEARSGGDASINRQAYTQGVFNVFNRVLGNFDEAAIPNTARELRRFGQAAVGGQGEAQPLVSSVFRTRARLTALQGSQGPEGAAAGQAKRELDRWLTDLLDDAALSGDRNAINRWRAAIAAHRDYAQRFQGGDLVEKLTERAYQGNQPTLKADANAAVNLIFGRSNAGWVQKSGMIRDLQRIRQELGDNSPAWNALREEAFLRLARSGEGASTPTGRDFSGANFAKAWEEAMTKNPEVMRTMFTGDERTLINQFARVARRVTVPVKGGVNTSNSSGGVVQVVRRLFASAFMGPKMAAFLSDLPVVRAISNLGYTISAESAARNALQTAPRPVPQFSYATIPAMAGASAQLREPRAQ